MAPAMIITIFFFLVFVSLIALCIWKPIVLRVIARIFAVLASTAGVAGIVGGIMFLVTDSEDFEQKEIIGMLAGGSGLLVGGIIALVLSFVGGRKKTGENQV